MCYSNLDVHLVTLDDIVFLILDQVPCRVPETHAFPLCGHRVTAPCVEMARTRLAGCLRTVDLRGECGHSIRKVCDNSAKWCFSKLQKTISNVARKYTVP